MAAFPLGGNFIPPNLAATQLLMQASTSNPKEMPPVSVAGLTRLPAMPDLPPVPQAYLPAHIAALNAAALADPRLLYSALSGAYMGSPEMKESPDALAAWRHLAAQANAAAAMGAAPIPPYESHNMAPGAGFPFPGYAAIDLNGTRRKNATRETTSTLKAWLYEHRKNPYPNKGEKIMLAIMTKMTLTQVSTWFANARRRLKKENKMTWSPRNRTEDGSEDGEEKEDDGNGDDDLSIDLSDFDTEGKQEAPEESKSQRTSLERQKSVQSTTEGPVSPTTSSPDKETKPKIWSLADVAANPTKHQYIHSQSVRHKPYHIPSQTPNTAAFRPWFEAQQALNRQLNPAAFASLHNPLNPAFMMTARPTVPNVKPEIIRQAGSPESTGSTHRPSTTSPPTSAHDQKAPLSLTSQPQTQLSDNKSTKE